MVQVFGLKSCDTCKKAIKWLGRNQIAHQFIELFQPRLAFSLVLGKFDQQQGFGVFDAAFLAFDYFPYDDDGYVRIFSTSSNQVVFASSDAAGVERPHPRWSNRSTS